MILVVAPKIFSGWTSEGFFLIYGINPVFFQGGDPEKNQGLQKLKFFKALKMTQVSQLRNQCADLKGRLRAYCPSIYIVSLPPSEQQLNQLFNCLHL